MIWTRQIQTNLKRPYMMFVLAKGNRLMLRSLVVDWGADRT